MVITFLKLPVLVIQLLLDIMGLVDMKIGNMDHVPSEFSRRPDGSFELRLYWNTNTNHGVEVYNTLNELFGAPRWTFKMDLDGAAAETHRNWVNWCNDTLSIPYMC